MIPQLAILGAALAVSAGLGWRATSWYYQAEISGMRADKARAAQVAAETNRKLELMGLELSGAVSERDAMRHRRLKVVEREVTKRVIQYVKSPAPKCNISGEWVSIHDAAAGGGVPEDAETPGTTDATPGAVADDTVLSVVAGNYHLCQSARAQLIALQEWARGIQGISP